VRNQNCHGTDSEGRSVLDELKSKLAIIAQRSSKTDMCLVLEQMLERGELSFEIHSEAGRERFDWRFSGKECSLLDQIGDVPDDTQRALLDLLVERKVQFSVDDRRGLDFIGG